MVEFTWSRKAEKAREEELWWRVKLNVVDTMISFIWFVTLYLFFILWQILTGWDRIWLPSATALTCFLCYTLVAHEKLTVSKAFTSIALFSYLQGPMVEFPSQIMALLQGVLFSPFSLLSFYQLVYSTRVDEEDRRLPCGRASPGMGLFAFASF